MIERLNDIGRAWVERLQTVLGGEREVNLLGDNDIKSNPSPTSVFGSSFCGFLISRDPARPLLRCHPCRLFVDRLNAEPRRGGEGDLCCLNVCGCNLSAFVKLVLHFGDFESCPDIHMPRGRHACKR